MTTVVFGSCMNHADLRGQTAWKEAAVHSPDWLLLGGDNVYMDFGPFLGSPKLWPPMKFAEEMLDRYRKQFEVNHFRKLVKSIPAGQVIGTWDDHDFGWNNCHGARPDYDMPTKRLIARALFHHYFNALNTRPLPEKLPAIDLASLATSPDASVDIYRALDIGPLRVLICDGRFYRERATAEGQALSLLGPVQEQWLLDEIGRATKPLLIVSGSTMTDAENQSWDSFKGFYRRFLTAVGQKVVVFVGGDIHRNRLSQPSGTRLTEIVSSGVLVFPVSRRYGVLEFDERELRAFLYRRTEIEFSGLVDLTTGKLRTKVVAEPEVALTEKRARRQKSAAMSKLRPARAARSGKARKPRGR